MSPNSCEVFVYVGYDDCKDSEFINYGLEEQESVYGVERIRVNNLNKVIPLDFSDVLKIGYSV